MQTETIIYIILAFIAALLLALFQYRYRSKKSNRITLILAALRFLTVFAILILLINPKFDQTTYYNQKPNLVVAIDNSESIDYLNQSAKAAELVNRIKENERLNEQFNIDYYSFGNDLKNNDSISFDETQSNMSVVFDRLSEVNSDANSAMLFITDGNQTYGNDFEFSTTKYKQPIFPVILGDTVTYSDLRIQQLNVNRYAYFKNRFPIEIISTYNGNSLVTTNLRVLSGSSVVFSQLLEFSKTQNSQIINFTLPANSVGVQTYRAELSSLEKEKNTVNNSKNFAVEVIDQKTKVAIVSELLHPDLGAFKKSIESNEQREADILDTNTYLKQSEDYQLVIAYQPSYNFKRLMDEVNRLQTNVMLVAGTKSNWRSINEIQTKYQQEITNQSEDFQPALNQNYSSFIVDDLYFSEWPPLKSEFGAMTFSVPFESILYKTINGTDLKEPLLATYEDGERREAILLGEGFWRWRAQSYLQNQSFETFDNFIGKLIQYLSSKKRRNRLNVNFESFYNGNDNIKITAQFFNRSYEFEPNAILSINLKNKETDEVKTVPFILKNTNYQVDLSGTEAGDYTFTVSVANENSSQSGELKILEYNVEQQFLNANYEKLERLANKSQGTPYFIDHTENLFDSLINDNRFAIVQKSSKNIVPLIDWKYLLVIITLSLAAEWFIRKYHGLI